MCGIAGYSLSSRSAVDRTLAAQSLLAGIAERGADAVGYAHRAPGDEYAVVTKQRTPASSLLERISVLVNDNAGYRGDCVEAQNEIMTLLSRFERDNAGQMFRGGRAIPNVPVALAIRM